MALAVTLWIQGCTIIGAAQEPEDIQVEFSSGEQHYDYAAVEVDMFDVVRQAEDQFAVTGAMRLPSPCYEVKALGVAYPDSVLLTIEATPTPHMCAAVETVLPYEAVLHSPPREGQALRVRHTYTGLEHMARTFQVGMP